MGEFVFDALEGIVYSDEALNNPYLQYISLQKNDLFQIPLLKGIITDTHYNNPDRRGRHLTFLARIKKDCETDAKGIGIQEETAVCIGPNGIAKVYGKAGAYFISAYEHSLIPESITQGQPLTWGKEKSAIKAVIVQESNNEYINLKNWSDYQAEFVQSFAIENGLLEIINEE